MTDKKKPEDVVVNLFKDTNEHIMTADMAKQFPPDHFNKLVMNQIDVIKEDASKHEATGVMTILFDDKGPLVDYFAGSINLHMAYVLMDQLKDVILEKLEEGSK
tara:strand:- start:700 stop:1011 length:312 start_codon:yes stop_codon:yes gene_type:complete